MKRQITDDDKKHETIDLGEGGKIDARLSPLFITALKLYMTDMHMENRSEVVKMALGQFFEKQGYLVRTKDGYEVSQPK
jgi:hypothetical protein